MILSMNRGGYWAGRLSIFAIGFAIGLAALSGCRTSQEARRTAQARRSAPGSQAGSQQAISQQTDSLLMIQEKLVEVIDSMTSLVSSDHERIRILENQVRSLEAQTGVGTPYPPEQADDYAPPVTAPPVTEPPQAEPPQAEPPHSAPPVAEPPQNASPSNAQYDEALRLFREREYPQALAAFQSLEVNDPNGALAGNYRYWQGECYFGEGNYARALRIFESMQNEYPNSPKASAAGFMRGQCYERLGDTRNARAAYERVIADFPNSNYSDRAHARLKALE